MEREPYPWGVVLVIVVFVVLFVFVQEMRGQMCGDCNDDGRVTVAELVRVVNNALNSPIVCELDCNTCPDECIELVRWTVDGQTYFCPTSFCANSNAKLDACVRQLAREGICEVQP
jgi:hypothetical protein